MLYFSGKVLQFPGFGEGTEASVVGCLDIVREAAAGKLLYRQMIAYTLTAHPLFVAARICAVAIF